LLARLRNEQIDQPLGKFAAELLPEIEKDYLALSKIAARYEDDSNTLKETTAWLAEKASRLKLSFTANAPLGTFESLETLALGVLGKQKLWQALLIIQDGEPPLAETDFDRLITRAQIQHDRIEAIRRQTADVVLRSANADVHLHASPK
jgi:hypothetical protein